MKPIVIIKTGDTLPEIYEVYKDFEHWISKGLRVSHEKIIVLDATKQFDLPDPENIAGGVIAGSHAMVTENLDWSLNIESWVLKMIDAGQPLLGICYGHQLIAKALGGKVDYHPKGMELGTVQVQMNPNAGTDPLFKDLPGDFDVHVSHSQSVVELPPGAMLLAGNGFERHHAFRIQDSAWGVQFHPEYSESIMKAYITQTARHYKEIEPVESDLLEKVAPTPYAALVLERFGCLALSP